MKGLDNWLTEPKDEYMVVEFDDVDFIQSFYVDINFVEDEDDEINSLISSEPMEVA